MNDFKLIHVQIRLILDITVKTQVYLTANPTSTLGCFEDFSKYNAIMLFLKTTTVFLYAAKLVYFPSHPTE